MIISKEQLLLEEIIFKHHREFKRASKEVRDFFLKPGVLSGTKVERYVEQSLADAGHLVRVKKKNSLCDYTDKSDCKTASVFPSPTNAAGTVFAGEISGLLTRSRSGIDIPKPGAIRAVVYNPHTETLEYYFLRRKNWLPLICRRELHFSWSADKNTIRKLAHFEVDTFADLAKIRSSDFVS